MDADELKLEWLPGPYNTLELRVPDSHAWIWLQPRNHYCDRGHFVANQSGFPDIDAADGFPRYYMNLERAKLELEDWVRWRLKCDKDKEKKP